MDSNRPNPSLHGGADTILWSYHNGAPQTEGIGFMLCRQAEKALIGWQPVSSRSL